MPDASSLTSPAAAFAGIVVRSAGPADLDALARIETAAFTSDRLSRRRLRAFVRSPSSDLLVAEAEREIVGYCLVLRRAGSGVARLYSLAIDPAQQGRRLGQALLGEAERAARSHGARVLRLEVRADNTAAISLYDGRGYLPIGRRDDYYQDGAAALRYEKCLASSARRDEARGLAPQAAVCA